jgi:hypothetical protein
MGIMRNKLNKIVAEILAGEHIVLDPSNGEKYSLLEDGKQANIGINHAALAKRKLGEGVVCTSFGHNFLLVNRRWIVDSWVAWVLGDKSKSVSVLDLENSDDFSWAHYVYGDPSCWEEVKDGP